MGFERISEQVSGRFRPSTLISKKTSAYLAKLEDDVLNYEANRSFSIRVRFR
jgi:hypothetical protein